MISAGFDHETILEIDEPERATEQTDFRLEQLSQEIRRLGRELFKLNRATERNQQLLEAATEEMREMNSALDHVPEQIAESVFETKAALCGELFTVVDALEASCAAASNLLAQLQKKAEQPARGIVLRFSKVRELHDELAAAAKVLSQWCEGQQLLYQRVLAVLQSAGVCPTETLGRPFNPSFHRAVSVETRRDLPAGTIVGEELKGFMLDGRVLRFAEVVVVKNG